MNRRNVPISPKKEMLLRRRMDVLGIREIDIEEKFVRSSGSGGQNVNKTSTCVMLHHAPTGIRVKCQIDRAQVMNRFLARRILVEKIEEREKGILSSRQKEREKIRRQKRRRSRRAKEKMLETKRKQSEKKKFRKNVFFDG